MKKNKKRSFRQLKKSMTIYEFHEFSKKITEEYANSEPQFARKYFTEYYNISEDCYYKLLEYAVVTNLVEDIIVSKIMNKAKNNQIVNSPSTGVSSMAKYARMYDQRCRYIANAFTNQEIRKIATDFGDNPDISKGDLASSYGVSRKVFEYILVKAIEENIADEKTVEAIERRSTNNAEQKNVQKTKEYFKALRNKREANKEGITLE